jgi:hypothetical protein
MDEEFYREQQQVRTVGFDGLRLRDFLRDAYERICRRNTTRT